MSSAQAEGAATAAAGERKSGAPITGQQGRRKLNLWRKRAGSPKPGEKPLPISVPGARLVELDALVLRDLNVPGKGEYSMMNIMAREGYDVWTWITTATATPAHPATTPTSPAASRI